MMTGWLPVETLPTRNGERRGKPQTQHKKNGGLKNEK